MRTWRHEYRVVHEIQMDGLQTILQSQAHTFEVGDARNHDHRSPCSISQARFSLPRNESAQANILD